MREKLTRSLTDPRGPNSSAAENAAAFRVLFVTNIPSPYQLDFFDALSHESAIDVRVFFCAPSEIDRQFSIPRAFPFKATILSPERFPLGPKDWHYIAGFTEILRNALPFELAVLSGSYFMPAVYTARRWLDHNKIPWLFWGESPYKKSDEKPRGFIKKAYVRHFLNSAKGVLGVGTRAAKVYESLMNGRLVSVLPYAPNLDPLLEPSSTTIYRAEQLRAEWGIDDPFVILFTGSLTQRKAPDLLLNAFASCARNNSRLRLLFAGEGPMGGYLVHEAAKLSLADRVRFAGFVEGADLHATFLSADLFVLPTRTHDGWGVVVQEALAAGLPVLVSDRVGAGWDLVDETTGRRFFVRERDSLTTCLVEMLAEPTLYGIKARRRRQEHVRQWSSTQVAKRFVDFVTTLDSRTGAELSQGK